MAEDKAPKTRELKTRELKTREPWRFQIRQILATVSPGVLWITVLFIIPSITLLSYSFLTRDRLGQVALPWTLKNYKTFFGQTILGYDPLYMQILLKTVLLALAITILCMIIGYPLAFFISRSKRKNLYLTLVIIPFWTNFLIRTYAWMLLLGAAGPITWVAKTFGFISEGSLYPSLGAVFVAMVYAHVPFFILPVYASVEKIDWRLVEAAADLGASPIRAFFQVVVPQTMSGIIAGVMLVFIPALGNFITPDLLGGSKQALMGNVIQQQFGSARNWAFGSALSFVVLAFVLIALYFYARSAGEEGMEVLG